MMKMCGMVMALLALASCSFFAPMMEPQLFTLNAPEWPATAASPPSLPVHISVATPRVAPGLDSERIVLRRGANAVDYYADAKWPERLSTLWRALTVRALENSGRVASASEELSGIQSDYLLVTELRDFQAEYTQPAAPPTIHIRLTATLLALPAHRVIATHSFEQSRAASKNTLDSVIATFDETSRALLQTMVDRLVSDIPVR